jgi:selenide,water dikinase
MTDVTGFGLAGHLLEMCRASGLGAEIQGSALPKMALAADLAAAFVLPDNAMRNWNAYEKEIVLQDQSVFPWLVDPQTNGGLLVAVDPGWNPKDHPQVGAMHWIGKFTSGQANVVVS